LTGHLPGAAPTPPLSLDPVLNMPVQESTALPRFAVCLAAFNGMAFIVEQLESILAQQGIALHVFISVDLSTDGTEAMLARWAAAEPRLTILPGGQRFGGAGPNFYRLLRDVALDGFDYVSFADQDDIWHPDKLARAHRQLRAHGAAGYSSNFTAFWPSGRERFVNKALPQRAWDFLFESAGPGCTYVLHARLALPLQQLVRGGGAELRLIDYHDWLTYAFARAHDLPWVIDNWSSMRYRQHASNQIGVNAGWRSFVLRARQVLNGYGFEQSGLIARVVGDGAGMARQPGFSGGRLGYLAMALRAPQCRRRRLDQVFFFVSCLLLAVVNPRRRVPA
jgi:rhamnosyltransferase